MLLLLAMAFASDAAHTCFPELDACYEDGNHVQLALNLCSLRAARICEAQRVAATERMGWTGDEAAFTAAEKAFQAFRKARCDRMAAPMEGGSGQPLQFHLCWSEVDAARTDELQRLLAVTQAPPTSADAADAALNASWKAHFDGTEGMRAVQRSWLAYRDAQCAWEVSRGGTKDACVAVLSTNRVPQLKAESEAAGP